MKEISVTRRGFIQGTGAAALAVACSGLLTACGGSSADKNEAVLGAVKVKVVSASDDVGLKRGNGSKVQNYKYMPVVRFTLTGSGSYSIPASSVFSATANGVSMSLSSGEDVKLSSEATDLLLGKSKTCTCSPVFTTSNSSAAAAFEDGGSIKLTVNIMGQSATFTSTYDGSDYVTTLDGAAAE